MPQLAEFATVRQGFCNSDGGHGLTYPEDLDGYEREVEKITIPHGHVLSKRQFHREAEAVQQLAERLNGREGG
jgi:hypothetical protein